MYRCIYVCMCILHIYIYICAEYVTVILVSSLKAQEFVEAPESGEILCFVAGRGRRAGKDVLWGSTSAPTYV